MAEAPKACKKCRHRIQPGSPYYERAIGPKCGGIIRSQRPPAGWRWSAPTLPPLLGAALEADPDQLELFYVLVVAR